MQLERRHLLHLAAVARHQSVTQAAAELAITQPALSRSIQEIERMLGLRCFDRLPHGVSPTPACRALLDRAAALLGEFAAFEQEAQRLAGSFAGSLAIGLGPAIAAGSAMLEVGLLIARHPKLVVRVVVESTRDLLRRLHTLDLDFIVCDLSHTEELGGALETDPIEHQARLFCRVGHPILGSQQPAAAAGEHPIAVLGAPQAGIDSLRAVLREAGARVGPDWTPTLQVDDASAFETLLIGSDFLGGSVTHAHAAALQRGELRVVPLPGPIYAGPVGPARLRDRTLSPAAEALWKAIAEAIRLDVSLGAEIATSQAAR